MTFKAPYQPKPFPDSITRSGLKSPQGRFRLRIQGMLSGSEGQLWDRLRLAGMELSPEVWMDKLGEWPLRKGCCSFSLGAGSGGCPAKDFPCSETLSLHSHMFCWERTETADFFAHMLELSVLIHCSVCGTQKIILSLNIFKSATFPTGKVLLV